MSDTIKKLTIEGFKSIKKLKDFELRSLNVLIGANGAGKSNLVEFFRLLRELAERRLQVFIGAAGGADAYLHLGPKVTRQVVGKVGFSDGGSYEFGLVPTVDNRFVFSDETTVFTEDMVLANGANASGGTPERVSLGSGHAETELGEGYTHNIFSSLLRGRLSGLGVYHFHDTTTTAGVRRQIALNQTGFLYSDGGNLAAFLNRIMYEDIATYMKIRDVVRLAAPFFDDFQLHPIHLNPALIQLEWTQKDSDYRFLASHLSDGTLRFICLATALLQANPPATMVFDEPELGLHPFALTLLGNLLQQAAHQNTQVIVSTQSAQLLNEFAPEDVIVVERTQGESVFRRLDSRQLSGWLGDYSIGQLWEKNVLGGGPRNEAIPLPSDGDEESGSAREKEESSAGDKG